MVFQGHIENGVVVFNEPVSLADGTEVRVEALAPVNGDFWQAPSIDELAAQQGVSIPISETEFLGGWPVDEINDGFEDALLQWRAGELEPRQ